MSDIDLRTVMSEFATGVTVVTLPGDPPHGITVNAFTSLSIDPPLVLVCLDHETEAHERLARGDADGYCVNILTADQQVLGEHFAGMGEDSFDPFEAVPVTTAVTEAPVFTESLAYLDCSIHEAVEGGDHTIYIGAVEEAELLEADEPPLTFYEGKWGTIADER